MMKTKYFLILLLIVYSNSLFAQNIIGNSEDIQINSISLNINSELSEASDYKFFTYPKNFSNDKFTIVYLPGGPGGSSSSFPLTYFGLDDSSGIQAQYVFIDPRGTGLNLALGEKYPEQLSTLTNAKDVSEVIKALKLSNYVIWGASYGTAVATILSHELSLSHENFKPKSVILEGTIGKYFNYSKYYYEDYEQKIKKFYANMPEKSEQLLKKYISSLSDNELIESVLMYFFEDAMYSGNKDIYFSFNDEINHIIYLSQTKDPDLQKVYEDFLEYEKKVYTNFEELNDSEKGFYLNVRIVCGELLSFKNNEELEEFKHANFFVKAKAPCIPSNEAELYDSAKYQITDFPVIYIQGKNDFQTSTSSARYHYKAVPKTQESSFTVFEDTPHSVFTRGLKICRASFIDDLIEESIYLPRTKKCANKNNIDFNEE